MPGPSRAKSRQKQKAKQSRTAPVPAPQDPYLNDIDNADEWTPIVNILCSVFELPDLSTRSGLKKVHANFETIYQKLEKAYEKNSNNIKLRAGIVGIYAKMCADSLLRNKLFDKGILSKLMPLLEFPSCHHLALRALSTVTRHGGEYIRLGVSQHAPALISLMQANPDDPAIAELVIVILAHAVGAVVDVDQNGPDKKRVGSLDLPKIIRDVTESVRNPKATHELINHALGLLQVCTLSCSDACKAYPPTLTLLAGALRSDDIIQRCFALGSLIRLHTSDAEEDQRVLDPRKFVACVRMGFPEHLSDIMTDYGPNRCDTYLTLECTTEYQKSMLKCAQDHDMYTLGVILARLIVRTEFSIADGVYQAQNPTNGQFETCDVGLPFKMWTDCLPYCIQALRDKRELDSADILQLKYFIIKRRIPEAVEHAKEAIKRNPDVAYFYYAVTLTANASEGLRYSKKGMKCKQTSPFVRFQMMQRAVQHAGDIGILTLQSAPSVGDRKWEEGVAFLTSALEDSKSYIDARTGAPPDNRHMKNVLYWNILLTITIRGAELSTDLRELQGTFKRLEIADDFSKFLGVSPPKTNLRLAQEYVVRLYPKGAKEWGEVIARFDSLDSRKKGKADPVVTPEKAEDDLAVWLEDMELDEVSKAKEREWVGAGCSGHSHDFMHGKVTADRVTLYRCSWCGNPSAALRKCSGCAMARYCDAGCQKLDWTLHKKQCNGKAG